ncbi:MAG: hypothetical protein ACLUGD_04120 [Ruminococcus sp.]
MTGVIQTRLWLKLHFAENATELLKMEKAIGAGSVLLGSREQLHVDVVPSQLRLPRRYAFGYVMIEVLDISSSLILLWKMLLYRCFFCERPGAFRI